MLHLCNVFNFTNVGKIFKSKKKHKKKNVETFVDVWSVFVAVSRCLIADAEADEQHC